MDLIENPDFQLIKSKHEIIAKKLSFSWGDQLFYTFFENLLADTRNGSRKGFDSDVFDALMRLYSLHANMTPKQETKTGIWSYDSRFGSF